MSPPNGDALSPVASAIRALTDRPATEFEIVQFRRYLNLLLKWNRVHRLTGVRSASGIVNALFVDSLLFLTWLPARSMDVVDVGTGPGIPGIPLKLVRPDIALTLIEAKRKRVSFLAGLTRELKLPDVRVLEGRAEDLTEREGSLREAFDVVLSRATGVDAVQTAIQYLRPGGVSILGGAASGSHPSTSLATARLKKEIQVRLEFREFPRLALRRAFVVVRRLNAP